MNKEIDINIMRKEISSIKKRLINKVNRKGLYENFGQKEVRYLTDKYHVFFQPDMAKELIAFEEWAMNYEPTI